MLTPYRSLTLLILVAVALTGCDGEGFKMDQVGALDSGDTATDGDGSDGGSDGGTVDSDNPFKGTWMTSYSDDFTSGRDRAQYAVSLTIKQSGTALSGSGKMFQMFRGDASPDEISLKLSGTASGNDAVLTLSPTLSGDLDPSHTWYLRQSSGVLVGLYQGTESGDLILSGHAIWTKEASSGSHLGDWVCAFNDDYGTSAWPARDRTGSLVVSDAGDNHFLGQGEFSVQQSGAIDGAQEFNITSGVLDDTEITFDLAEVHLSDRPMSWSGFFSGNRIYAVYGQFDIAMPTAAVRVGQASWRQPGSDQVFTDAAHRWVGAFADTTTATGIDHSDFLGIFDLVVVEGGGISGTASILEEQVSDEYVDYTVTEDVNASFVSGNEVVLELTGDGRTFLWRMRLVGSVMVGSYQLFDAAGSFISQGNAEWRYNTTNSLVGTWAAAYYDTYGEGYRKQTQLASMTISLEDASGNISGAGAVRMAGDSSRDTFTASGWVEGTTAAVTWSGSELGGGIVWHFQKAGSYLFGTYTDYTTLDGVESQGHAIWVSSPSS